jgi:hypothetical protein
VPNTKYNKVVWLIPTLLVLAGTIFDNIYTKLINHVAGYLSPRVDYTTLLQITLLLLVLLVSYYLHINKKDGLEIDNSDNKKGQIPTDAPFCSKPIPKEIEEAIDSQQELDQEEFAKRFMGLVVDWTGTFATARRIENDGINVCVSSDNHNFWFKTTLTKHPIFKSLVSNKHRIMVSGTILEAYPHIILHNVEFQVLKNDQHHA